jgi:hypothetical protein
MVSSELLQWRLSLHVGEGAALSFEEQCGSIKLLQESASGSKLHDQKSCIQEVRKTKGTLCFRDPIAHWSPSGCLMSNVLGPEISPLGRSIITRSLRSSLE